MKKISLLLVFTFLACICIPLFPSASAAPAEPPPSAFDGYIVKLSDEAAAPDGLDAGVCDLGEGYYSVSDLGAALQLAEEEHIEYIEPNYYVELFSSPSGAVSTDEYYDQYQWNLRDIGFEDVWTAGLYGNGVRIGVIDSGLVAGHEDIDYSLVKDGQNLVEQEDDFTWADDKTGHGTFVTGIIASVMGNGMGLAGAACGAEIVPLRCFSTMTVPESTVIRAIRRAVELDCDIINMSFGMYSQSAALKSAIDEASAAGIIMVASVGNLGTAYLSYPAAYDGVIGVGSVNSDKTLSSFSNRNAKVFVTAPGGGVPSLENKPGASYMLDLSASSNRGTSYAAPVVTAMAAVAKGARPDLTASEFMELLKTTSLDLGAPGRDDSFGYGLVDAAKMVRALDLTYPVGYELYGGAFPDGSAAPASFRSSGAELTLPSPDKSGSAFLGWYDNPDFSGAAVSVIPSGSVGAKHFYAKWLSLSLLDPVSVKVRGKAAQLSALTGRYEAALTISASQGLAASDIAITGAAGVSVSPPAKIDGSTWKATLSLEGQSKDVLISILHKNTPPQIKLGAMSVWGAAAPASLDGLTPAVPHVTELSEYFSDDDGDELSFALVFSTAQGSVAFETIGGKQCAVFTPAPDDEGGCMYFEFSASDGEADSDSNLFVMVDVNPVPASRPVIKTAGPLSFDRYAQSAAHKSLDVSIALYGGTVLSIKNGAVTVPQDKYTLSLSSDILGDSKLTISSEYLSTLGVGSSELVFSFGSGMSSKLALTVSDTAPAPVIPSGDGGAPSGGGLGGGGAAVVPVPAGQDGADKWGEITDVSDLSLFKRDEARNSVTVAAQADKATITVTVKALREAASKHPGLAFELVAPGGGVAFSADLILEGSSLLTKLESKGLGDDAKLMFVVSSTQPDEKTKALAGKSFSSGGLISEAVSVQAFLSDGKLFYPVADIASSGAPMKFEVLIPLKDGLKSLPKTCGAFMLSLLGDEFVPRPFIIRQIGGKWYVAVQSPSSSCVLAENPAAFSDVSSSAWYYGPVSLSASRGFIRGVGEGRFQPQRGVTRAEFVQMMVNMLGYPAVTGYSGRFTLDAGAWYYPAVTCADANGLLTGFDEGDFRPNALITREEMASVLSRVISGKNIMMTMEWIDLETVFVDYAKIDERYLPDVQIAFKLGLMKGVSPSQFDPKGPTTRAQAATVMQNLMSVLGMAP